MCEGSLLKVTSLRYHENFAMEYVSRLAQPFELEPCSNKIPITVPMQLPIPTLYLKLAKLYIYIQLPMDPIVPWKGDEFAFHSLTALAGHAQCRLVAGTC